MDIYISTDDYSVYPSYPVNSFDSFVTENLYPSFDRDNPLVEYSTIHHITSKYLDNITTSTTEE